MFPPGSISRDEIKAGPLSGDRLKLLFVVCYSCFICTALRYLIPLPLSVFLPSYRNSEDKQETVYLIWTHFLSF